MQKTGGDAFVKKSGWRKIGTAFGLTLEKVDSDFYKVDGHRVAEISYRAVAPGGQSQEATAWCSEGENSYENRKDKDKLVHDVAATAETRAKNRAISDLVGGGEVSYEEVNNG